MTNIFDLAVGPRGGQRQAGVINEV